MQDKGWISPPDSICSSISESCIDPAEELVPDCLNKLAEDMGQLLHGSSATGQNTAPFSQTDFREISHFGQLESKDVEINVVDTVSGKSVVNEPNESLKGGTPPSNESEIGRAHV